MAWQLSRAVLRCQCRRALAAWRSAPLPGALLLAVAAASPYLLWRAGHALGIVLEPVLREPEAAGLLGVAPAVGGATAGAALCVTATGRRSLGLQIAALPVGARSALVATCVAPAVAVLVLGLPAALALVLALGASSPGGAVAGTGFLAGALAGAAGGAVVTESILHAWAGARRRGAVALLALCAAWSGAGALLGSAALGPLAPLGASLAGSTDAVAAPAVAVVAAVCGGVAWLELAARRPERVPPAPAATGRRVAGPLATALPLAALALLLRRRDVRLASFAATGFGLGGVVLASRAEVAAPGPLHLGASSTLLGAALTPLAVGGCLVAGRWAWACAPRLRVLPCAALVLAASVALFGALAPVLVVAAVVSGAPAYALAEVWLVALGTAAAAVLAGALVPWRGITMGDQVACLAAFAACAGLYSAVAGVTGPRLVAWGLSDGAAAGCVIAVGAAVSLGAALRRLVAAG